MHKVIVPDNLRHAVTAFFTGKAVASDIDVIASIAGISRTRIFLPVQKHTDKVLVLNSPSEPKIADAVVTREHGILIGVKVADCVPVLLYDREKRIAGAVHAGWRGTPASILKKTIDVMKNRFFCEPKDLMVAIGPSIRGCCYQVGPDTSEAVVHATGGIPGALVQIAIATVLGALATTAFGWSLGAGVVFGLAMYSVASTVVLIRVLSDHDALHTPAGHIAVAHSHPRWLVERWMSGLGFEQTLALAKPTTRSLPWPFA